MHIRRIVEKDHVRVRELRLAALQDSPNSFADSYQDTLGKPAQYWVDLTKALCEKHVMFIAEEDGEPIGSTYGLRDSSDEKVGRVAGMWVCSAYRARGFGKALLQHVVSWAEYVGFQEVRLWAPAKNANVLAFYHNAGFKLTGIRQQSANPKLAIVEMKRLFGVQL